MIIVISLILYIIITSLYIKSKFNIIDIEFENRLDVLNERRKSLVIPELKAKSGILYKYAKTVSSASEGCVTDEF